MNTTIDPIANLDSHFELTCFIQFIAGKMENQFNDVDCCNSVVSIFSPIFAAEVNKNKKR